MFYGSSSAMSPPSKNKLKRQSRIFSQVLYRTLSYKDRSSVSAFPLASSDDPAELSTQVSAPGVLKIFGGNICAGTNYKSVLATGSSSARELVKEALERYGLSKVDAGHYVLCDVIGVFSGSEKQWQTEGLRVLGDNEKPLLIQDLWKPKEGFSRRLELRKRSEVEELAARDVDTITAGINAQARKLQRNRAKGTMTLLTGCKRHSTPPTLRRSVSETSLSHRHYSTVRYSLYQSPHLLLLQGYSYQHVTHPGGQCVRQLLRSGKDDRAAPRRPPVSGALLPASLQGPHEGPATASSSRRGAPPPRSTGPPPPQAKDQPGRGCSWSSRELPRTCW
uniref:Rap associating with DIL domain n=1 Tax=Terrapene triunguis TaxID=2587831 RepID=A0A674JH30_9SAUR